ncbi:hypothetical protein G4Y79_03450 [Phototrophicus methaneseepsis]|uniref:Tetratricopeptide repeat protein n=1 Tax=Phototrophicus methaneseepsis TaxID=2710758 RepID=A0A7S8EAM5_9CHLR|nr:hypothetical protein [Phototrophicus methaneseepsis]QPC83450.1 hypothetical protein G4Y79_03450 [Phototrophicus methaneseepsis]
MKRFLLVLLICMVATSSVLAQSVKEQWQADCERLEETWLLTDSVCREYIGCLYDQYGEKDELLCYYDTYTNLLAQCQLSERDDCIQVTAMSMIELVTVRNNPSMSPQTPSYTEIFNLYEDGKIEAALEEVSALETSIWHWDFPIFLTEGIFYTALDQPEAALEAYSTVIEARYDNPLAYYLRGQVYLTLGDTEHASRDFYNYNIYATPALWDLIPPPQLVFSMPEDMTAWRLYSVVYHFFGPGREVVKDLSLDPAIDVQIAFLDDGETALITNMPDEHHPFVLSRPIFLSRNESEEFTSSYTISVPADYGIILGGSSYISAFQPTPDPLDTKLIWLSIQDQIIIYEYDIGYESVEVRSYILESSTLADPRSAFVRPCPGLPISWLRIGDELSVSSNFGSPVYQGIDTDIEIIPPVFDFEEQLPPYLTVINGPLCGEEYVWWQVTIDGGQIGWIPEDYSLLPERVSSVLFDDQGLPTLDDLIELANN